jgi:membrane protein
MLFTVGKFAIGMYLGKAGVQSGFGAAGSIVVLLVWVFYSSQIFLLGAEFTWLYAHNHGTRAGEAASSFPATRPSATVAPQPGAQSVATQRRGPAGIGDFATAGLVWLGFGAIRSFVSRRSKAAQ